jgi:hypothetical protein
MTVPGEGMPMYEDSDRFGDLHVEFTIKFPTTVTDEQKEGMHRLSPYLLLYELVLCVQSEAPHLAYVHNQTNPLQVSRSSSRRRRRTAPAANRHHRHRATRPSCRERYSSYLFHHDETISSPSPSPFQSSRGDKAKGSGWSIAASTQLAHDPFKPPMIDCSQAAVVMGSQQVVGKQGGHGAHACHGLFA